MDFENRKFWRCYDVTSWRAGSTRGDPRNQRYDPANDVENGQNFCGRGDTAFVLRHLVHVDCLDCGIRLTEGNDAEDETKTEQAHDTENQCGLSVA